MYQVHLMVGEIAAGWWETVFDQGDTLTSDDGTLVLDGLRAAWDSDPGWFPDQPDPTTCSFALKVAAAGQGPELFQGQAVVVIIHGPDRDSAVPPFFHFAGRVSDIDAQPDGSGLRYNVVCVDDRTLLAEQRIGDEPWPEELQQVRFQRIVAASQQPPQGAGLLWSVVALRAGLMMTLTKARDVDAASTWDVLLSFLRSIPGWANYTLASIPISTPDSMDAPYRWEPFMRWSHPIIVQRYAYGVRTFQPGWVRQGQRTLAALPYYARVNNLVGFASGGTMDPDIDGLYGANCTVQKWTAAPQDIGPATLRALASAGAAAAGSISVQNFVARNVFVTPGRAYTFTARVRCGSVASGPIASARIDWYNAAGDAILSTAVGSNVALNWSNYQTARVTATAPAGAYGARLRVYFTAITDGHTYYTDTWRFGDSVHLEYADNLFTDYGPEAVVVPASVCERNVRWRQDKAAHANAVRLEGEFVGVDIKRGVWATLASWVVEHLPSIRSRGRVEQSRSTEVTGSMGAHALAWKHLGNLDRTVPKWTMDEVTILCHEIPADKGWPRLFDPPTPGTDPNTDTVTDHPALGRFVFVSGIFPNWDLGTGPDFAGVLVGAALEVSGGQVRATAKVLPVLPGPNGVTTGGVTFDNMAHETVGNPTIAGMADTPLTIADFGLVRNPGE